MGVESGTCNVCSSPCKSCMHNNRTVLDMESKEECGSSCNRLPIEEDVSYSSTYANEMPRYEKRSLDDLPFTGSEANNLLSSSSNHDPYSKNAESKASVRAYATRAKFEDVDMSPVSLRETNRNQSMEKTSVATDFSHRIHLKQDEEVISCLTENKGSNFVVGHYNIGLDKRDSICTSVANADIKNIVKVKAKNCFPGSDTKESQSNRRRYIADPENSLKECEDSVCSPFHTKHNHLSTHNGYDGSHKNDCKSLNNSLNCQVNDDGKSSLKTQIVEHKYSEGKNSAGPCLTDENILDKDVSSKAAMVSTTINNEFEMSRLLDESNAKESQQVIEGGSSGTEQELTDVNVCDICGDVGREYLLAVCSNCSDGAEHIYCMRTMLRKVPEGDWLCETCQLKKQSEKKNVENPKETISTTGKCKLNVGPEITKMGNSDKLLQKPKELKLKKCPDTLKRDICDEFPETSKLIKKKYSSMSNLKTVTKFDTKPMDPDRKKAICKRQSPNFSAKRHAEYQEVLSPNSRPPDINGRYVEMGSPRKKPCLSREASFKILDARKEKTICTSLPNRGQNTNKIPSISRSQSMLGSHLSKATSPLQSPRGLISRSTSFNINPTSKVKQYAEDVPFKREVTESSLSEQRKNALLRSKSASFKGTGNKSKLYVDPRSVLLHKKKENMENKCNLTTDHLPASPKAITGIHISKTNMKTTMSNVKSKHHLYEPKRQRLDKGSSDANDIRIKSSMKHSEDQRLCHSPSSRTCVMSIKEPVQSNSTVKIAESATCGEIPKAPTVFSTPKIAVSNTSTQSCSTDKLKSSALEPCSENNSMDDGIKRNRWKDAVKKTILKAKSQNTSNNNGLDNQLAELPPASNGISHIVEISNGHNISTVSEDSPSAEIACTFEDTHSPEKIDLNVIAAASDDTTIQASGHANSHMNLAIPNFDYIWQGSFEVSSEVDSAPYYGIQAHLSASASPKVHEMTTKFPTEIMLEEVPWTSSWPTQFLGTSPDENNIALFFFAKDIESYEKSYSKLVEKMLKNDLSLKGIIDGVELLIFPSTKLPVQSQRWNRLFFLWGVFKARRYNNFMPKSSYQTEPFRPNLNFGGETTDLPLTPDIEVSNCKLPSCAMSSACMDNVVASTPKVEDISFMHKSQSSDHNPSISSNPYNSPLDDQKSSFLSTSYGNELDHSNPASYFRVNNSHLSNKTFSPPESRFQMTNAPPCAELKNDSSYLKNFDSNMRGNSAKTSAHLSSSNVQIWHSRESHLHPTSSGTDNSRSITKGKEIPVKNEYIFYDEYNKQQENRSNTHHACSHPNYLPLPSPTSNEILNSRASPSVHPLFRAIAKSDDTKVADKEILFLPDGTRTVPNTQPDNVVEILSSDEEAAINPDRPNLDLVLWNKHKSELEEKWKMIDANDEESASLSLSLAIPVTKKDQSKKEDDSEGKSNANAPLRLFGRSIGI